MRVLIIADDLTGALDSAVALTGAGLRCVVARRPGDVAAALAVRPGRARRQHRVARGQRRGGRGPRSPAALDAVGALPEIVFKKVDFAPQGPCRATEVAVVAERGGSRARAGRAGDPGAGPGRRGRPADRRRGRRADRRRGGGRRRAASRSTVPDTRTDADLDAALGAGARRAAAAAGRRGRAGGGARAPARAGGAWSMPAPRLAGADPARDRLARSDHPRPGRPAGRHAAAHGGGRRRTGSARRAPAGGRAGAAGAGRGAARSIRGAAGGGLPRGLRNLSGRAGSGRCSAAAARRRTRSSARWGWGFWSIEGEVLPGFRSPACLSAGAGCNLSPSQAASAARMRSSRSSRRRGPAERQR